MEAAPVNRLMPRLQILVHLSVEILFFLPKAAVTFNAYVSVGTFEPVLHICDSITSRLPA
jgi:hypothetical protein